MTINVRTTKTALVQRQVQARDMIRNNRCTISCAGAIYADGPCYCKCGGLNHGTLWFDEIAVDYD